MVHLGAVYVHPSIIMVKSVQSQKSSAMGTSDSWQGGDRCTPMHIPDVGGRDLIGGGASG